MRLRKILRGAAVAALIVLALLTAAFLWLRSRGLPRRSGEAPLAGLAAPVEVRFDRFGVPTVTAASSLDAFAAVGWLHANDRLFQMELARRAAAGRLSELFGERALEFDRRMRRLRFRRVAEQALERTSPATRRALEAYAAGVNAWLAERRGDLPPEFRLLRDRPEPWSPVDTLAFVQMMARNLSPIDDPPENDYFRFLRAFGGERARELAGDADATLFDEVTALAARTPFGGAQVGAQPEAAGLGSNNWAVGPGRSAAGHALVANDPHLGLGLPGVWYQIAIRAPDYQASGMSFPGTPTVTIGRGPDVAWAFTNLYVDDVDVFVEELDPSGAKVRRADGWETIAVETETIRLDDGTPVEIETKTTSRGVFLDADPQAGLPPRSVAWTGYEPGDQFAAILALARCHSVAEVPAAIEPWVFPGQNLVAADRAGHLLWTPIGRAPNRFGWDGRFPAPGWRADVGWAGLHPAALNPTLTDPPDGVLATANSFLPVAQPAWFEGDFDTPYRAERIRQALASRADWSVESLAALEGDTVSLWARTLVGELGSGYRGDAERARAALAAWNGDMTAAGVPALFALFERALQRATFEDEATRAGLPRFGTRWRLLHLLRGEISPAWWDDVATPATEDRPAILSRALESAWRQGSARWGDEVARWPYAGIHRLRLQHALGSLPVIGRWWNRGPFAVPGSATSVLAFGGPWRDDELDVAYGPSMRLVSDAADPDRTLAVMPGGQSGHPGDEHYADQIADYLENRAHPFPWSEAAIEAATRSRLKLVPTGGAR